MHKKRLKSAKNPQPIDNKAALQVITTRFRQLGLRPTLPPAHPANALTNPLNPILPLTSPLPQTSHPPLPIEPDPTPDQALLPADPPPPVILQDNPDPADLH